MRTAARRILIAAAGLMLLLNARSASAQAMTPPAFAAELRRVEQAVSAGEPGRIPEVSVPASWTVEVSGQRFDVSSAFLLRALDEARRVPSTWPARRAALLEHLRALQSETLSLGVRTSAGSGSPAAARAALEQVLSSSEFQQMRRQNALSRLRQRIAEWLVRLWDRLGGGTLGRRGTATAFAWIAAFAALIVLTIAVLRMLRPAPAARVAPQPVAERRSARALARAARATTDARTTMRLAYAAAICWLEEEGVWSADDTRTPREYLRLLPLNHRRRPVMDEMTRRFEEIWYAAREASESDRAAALAHLRELGCLPVD